MTGGAAPVSAAGRCPVPAGACPSPADEVPAMASHFSFRTLLARVLGLAAVLACPLFAPTAPAPSEAIRDLRDALAIGATDTDVNERKLAQRREAIEDALGELKTVNDLYQALILPDWKDGPSEPSIKLFDLDRSLRTRVKDRLLAALRAGLK